MNCRNTSFLLVLTLFLTLCGLAQSPGIEWQKTFQGSVSKTLILSDSSMILAGSALGAGGSVDVRICKLGHDGNIIWNKFFGGSAREEFLDFYSTPDGGFIFAATTLSSDGDIIGFHGPNNGSNDDIWIVKLSATGALQWQKSLGSSGSEVFKQLLVQPDGSSCILGISAGGGDFQPVNGPCLAKLDQNGNLVYATIIGDYKTSYTKMIAKPNGNLFIIGSYLAMSGFPDVVVSERNAAGLSIKGGSYGGIAMDVGVDVLQTGAEQFTVLAEVNSPQIAGYHGQSDLWLLTFNNSGNIIWQKCLGGSGVEQNAKIYFDAADSTIMLLASTASNDGDVSGNHGGFDVWVTKLSNAGTLLWQRCLGGSGTDGFTQVQKNANNQVYMLGTTSSTDIPGSHGDEDLWFVNLDGATGSVNWQKSLGGTLKETPVKFNIEPDGFTLLANTTSQDGDVQGMHYNEDTVGASIQYRKDIWVVNLGSSGIMNWQKPLGGFKDDFSNDVFKIKSKYFVFSNAGSNDGDVSGSPGAWVVKLGLSNIIMGTVFIDANSNGILDPGERAYDDVIVKSEKSNYARWSIPYNGRYRADVDSGLLTTSIALDHPYYTAVPVSRQTTFTGYFQVDSLDFALQPAAGKRDLAVNLVNPGAFRPGFSSYHFINYKNRGTDTIATGKVYLFKDSNTVFVSAVPAPDDIMGDTLSWNYSNLLPNSEGSISVTLNIKTPPKVNAGDTLKHVVSIEPDANDLVPGNNRDSVIRISTGSYDPNDKLENHGGYISLADATSREELSYVINFQNVGTDTAFTIVVRDTLGNKLDWNTLQIVGASHSYSLQIVDGNKCVWTFNNIGLPHAGINEPASRGYIAFTLKPKAGLVVGEAISNTASIYFDYNLPIVTNTVTTTVQPNSVEQPVISGLVNNYCSSDAAPKVKLHNVPDGANVTVRVDNTTLAVATDNTVTIALSSFTGGSHTLHVTYANSVSSKTTIAVFTIAAAVTPDVNLSANTTNVVNLANPVVVTAANASGGGKNPLYTFAWNNSFTNIIQAESNSNTLSIQASSLALGDNKIYVKMKTGENCSTTQTNIDSITVRRDMSTGITDTDNPGQVITLYPNPVKGPITIKGLSTGKAYTFIVVNLQGQVVFRKRVANQSTANITGFNSVAGIYLLKIYDEKNSRMLGYLQFINN